MAKNCVSAKQGHLAVRLVSPEAASQGIALILLSFFRVRYWGKFASMIANSVQLSEVLRQMEEGKERFTIRFVRTDRKRKTGGQIEEWHNCRLSKRRVRGAQQSPVLAEEGGAPVRMPSHYQHATRNIVQGTSSQVRKVHIWLLLAFNGQPVVLG